MSELRVMSSELETRSLEGSRIETDSRNASGPSTPEWHVA